MLWKWNPFQVEKLRRALGTAAADGAASPASPPFSAATAQMSSNRSPFEVYGGGLAGRDRQSVLGLAGRALEELKTMCSSGEPLWVRSVETGRDILNYDEYVRLFRRDDGPGDRRAGWSVEASRETGLVYLDATKLVYAFMDVVRASCHLSFVLHARERAQDADSVSENLCRTNGKSSSLP